jgi:hypothetical protein
MDVNEIVMTIAQISGLTFIFSSMLAMGLRLQSSLPCRTSVISPVSSR